MDTQLCSTCDTQLTDDISIFIYDNGVTEKTICEGCNSELETQLRNAGYTEQGDED